jgi:hypothetical protein
MRLFTGPVRAVVSINHTIPVESGFITPKSMINQIRIVSEFFEPYFTKLTTLIEIIFV